MDNQALKQNQHDWCVAWQDHGDRLALSALVDSVRPMAIGVAGKHRVSEEVWDDLLAECTLAAVEAAGKYDRTRLGAAYAPLAAVHMRGRCRAALKLFVSPVTSSGRVKLADAGRGVALLADHEEGEEGVVLAAPEIERAPVERPAALEGLFSAAGLDDRECYILGRFARGEKNAEACAQRLGVSLTRIGQLERRALAKVRAVAEQRGLELQDLL